MSMGALRYTALLTMSTNMLHIYQILVRKGLTPWYRVQVLGLGLGGYQRCEEGFELGGVDLVELFDGNP